MKKVESLARAQEAFDKFIDVDEEENTLPKTVYLSSPAEIDEESNTQEFKIKSSNEPDFWGRIWNIQVVPNWELDYSGFPYTDWETGGWASIECFHQLDKEVE